MTIHLFFQIGGQKQEENFSFEWLKMQLENRVNNESERYGHKLRADLEISPFHSDNAKKALNMWKKMEKSMTES